MLEKIFPKIHTEGYKFLAIAIFITIFLYFINSFKSVARSGLDYLGLLLL